MIIKVIAILGVAVCALAHQPAISEQNIIRHYGHHGHLEHIGHHAPAHHEQYAHSHPSYEFAYTVHDPHTGDNKGHKEHREGDVTKGEYWLIEPDGNKRTVTYTVDGKSGFQAKVHNSGPHHHIDIKSKHVPIHHEPIHHVPIHHEPIHHVPIHHEPIHHVPIHHVPIHNPEVHHEPHHPVVHHQKTVVVKQLIHHPPPVHHHHNPIHHEPIHHELIHHQPNHHELIHHQPIHHQPIHHEPIHHEPIRHHPVHEVHHKIHHPVHEVRQWGWTHGPHHERRYRDNRVEKPAEEEETNEA